MPARKTPSKKQHIEYFKDGGIRAKGPMADGQLHGYWQWFRKDGTRLRSGYFTGGKQTGNWTTYDKQDQVYKVTKMK